MIERLTLNLGLRYEYAGATEDALGIARNLDRTTLELFPVPGESGALHGSNHDVVPRLGATYRWTDDTVVRAGYGHYMTQPTMANVALMFRNPPFNREDVFNTVRTSPTLTLANGFPEGGQSGSTATPTLTTIAQDYGPALAKVWSANVQRRLQGRLGCRGRLRRLGHQRSRQCLDVQHAGAWSRRRAAAPAAHDVRRHPRLRHRRPGRVQRPAVPRPEPRLLRHERAGQLRLLALLRHAIVAGHQLGRHRRPGAAESVRPVRRRVGSLRHRLPARGQAQHRLPAAVRRPARRRGQTPRG